MKIDEFKMGDVLVEIDTQDEWFVYTHPSEGQYFVRQTGPNSEWDCSRPSVTSFQKNLTEKCFVKVRNEYLGKDDD